MSFSKRRVGSLLVISLLIFSLFPLSDFNSAYGTLPSYYGVQDTNAAGSTRVLSTSTGQYSIDFTANYTSSVRAIGLYIFAVTGTSPFFQAGIQGDNNGVPNNVFINSAVAKFKPTAGVTWQQFALNATASLTKGTVYHLVIQYLNGTINSSNSITLLESLYNYRIYSYDDTPDPAMDIRFIAAGTNWAGSNLNRSPLYFLNYTSGLYQGETYSGPIGSTATANVFGSNRIGETFTPTRTMTIGELELNLYRYGNPTSGLVFQIYNVTGSAVLYNSTISAGDIPHTCCGLANWIPHVFTPALTFKSGNQYTLFIYTSGGNATNGYVGRYLATNNVIPTITNNQTWGGTRDSYVSSAVGGVPSTKTTTTDLMFRFTIGAVTLTTTTTVTSTTTTTTTRTNIICYSPPSNPHYVFFNGFESGNFSKWNSTAMASTGNITVTSHNPINGSYSEHVHIGNDINGYGYAVGTANLTALGNSIWTNLYMRVDNFTHVPNKEFHFMSLRNTTAGSAGAFIRMGLKHLTANQHVLEIEVNTPAGSTDYETGDFNLMNNTVNEFELNLFKNANGYIRAYVNGSLVIDIEHIKTDYPAFTLNNFRVGVTATGNGLQNFNVTIDNVGLSNSRIGTPPFSCVGYSTSVKIIPLQTQINPNNLFLAILSPLIIIPFIILYSQKRRKQSVPN